MANKQQQSKTVLLVKSPVGQWGPGETFVAEDFPGVDIGRLVGLGAVEVIQSTVPQVSAEVTDLNAQIADANNALQVTVGGLAEIENALGLVVQAESPEEGTAKIVEAVKKLVANNAAIEVQSAEIADLSKELADDLVGAHSGIVAGYQALGAPFNADDTTPNLAAGLAAAITAQMQKSRDEIMADAIRQTATPPAEDPEQSETGEEKV
jgi:hypothetical protein